MTVDLLSTSDDPRTLDKTTTAIASLTAKPTENCSILSPRLIINYTAAASAANYMYIQDFGRYYFIDNITVSTGSELILSGSVDVLKTYSSEIKACEATVIRSESIGKPTIYPDSKLPIVPNKYDITSIVLPSSIPQPSLVSNTCFLLIVRG